MDEDDRNIEQLVDLQQNTQHFSECVKYTFPIWALPKSPYLLISFEGSDHPRQRPRL